MYLLQYHNGPRLWYNRHSLDVFYRKRFLKIMKCITSEHRIFQKYIFLIANSNSSNSCRLSLSLSVCNSVSFVTMWYYQTWGLFLDSETFFLTLMFDLIPTIPTDLSLRLSIVQTKYPVGPVPIRLLMRPLPPLETMLSSQKMGK